MANIVIACRFCNGEKDDDRIEEFRYKIAYGLSGHFRRGWKYHYNTKWEFLIIGNKPVVRFWGEMVISRAI